MGDSKWQDLKSEVMELRNQGTSLSWISREYGIARSTLSYWFKDIELTDEQLRKLQSNSAEGLERARLLANVWHRNQKNLRIKTAEIEAKGVLGSIDRSNELLELALAMLYFGEGAKNGTTSMGSSDPQMQNFFIKCLENLYGLNRLNFRYDLHLRYDQNEEQMKSIWSQELDVPVSLFKYVIKDIRTEGKPTKNGYKGVCLITAGNIAIQRRLKALYNLYCSEIIRGM